MLGNQVTPIAIKLDGLAALGLAVAGGRRRGDRSGASYTLQIVGGSSVYGPVRSAGSVALKAIRLSMPSIRR